MDKTSVIKVGDVFPNTVHGDMVVRRYNGFRDCEVEFMDGTLVKCRSDKIKLGVVENPNTKTILGIGWKGPAKTNDKGKVKKSYVVWRNMMHRCYNPKTQKRQPSYVGCSVGGVWHNFTVFEQWYDSQPINDQYSWELDKDTICIGNREYSPTYCRLIPAEVNRFLPAFKSNKTECLVGVYKRGKKFCTQVCYEGSQSPVICFYSATLAYEHYSALKKEVASNLALKYQSCICADVYAMLLNFDLDRYVSAKYNIILKGTT